MEAYLSEIIVGLISSVGIPLVIYGIRYLRSLGKKTEFDRKAQIEEFVFRTLESQVVTHM